MQTLTINLPKPHQKQTDFIQSPAPRKIIRAGRRGGKTVGVTILAVEKFLQGKRILYAAPTQEQVDRFWVSATRALQEPIDAGVFYKNETKHIIELANSEQRIRAKTAWNADSLRGDYADILIMDEFQLIAEDAWNTVGAPMLADNNGAAIFIYTPPSLHSRSVSKAQDPQNAAKMFKRALADTTGRWQAFNFTSYDNPYISKEALDDLAHDMTSVAYRMEIMAEDLNEAPGALWRRDDIDRARVIKAPELDMVVVGVDPSATAGGDEAGIITAGRKDDEYYTLADDSIQGSPQVWATAAVTAYHKHQANAIIAEDNNGGEMVEAVIKQVDPSVIVKRVHASRGKATRAEPVAAISEQGRDHHVGTFPQLEDELCLWMPGDTSPNRLDAKVWAITELMKKAVMEVTENPFYS